MKSVADCSSQMPFTSATDGEKKTREKEKMMEKEGKTAMMVKV